MGVYLYSDNNNEVIILKTYQKMNIQEIKQNYRIEEVIGQHILEKTRP